MDAPTLGPAIDPADPRTWWVADSAAHQGKMPAGGQMPDHIVALSSVPARLYYSDPRVCALTSAAVSAYYGMDGAPVAGELYNYEVEALGGALLHSDEAMPTIDVSRPLIGGPADLDRLAPPADWLAAGRVRYAWETARLIREMDGVRVLNFCAPFSLAVGLITYPRLIRAMRRDPAFAHELFSRLVDDVLPSYLAAQREYLGGADLAFGADAWAAFPNLGPDMHEEWVLPYALRLQERCRALGFESMLAVSAEYCEEDLAKFDQAILWKTLECQVKLAQGRPSVSMIMGRWHEYPLEPVVAWLARWRAQGLRASLTVGINARLLREGPPARIAETVKRFVRTFACDHDLALFLSGVPADTSPDHVHAAVAAAHSYGRLPLAEDLDGVTVALPRRESFREYVEHMSGGRGLPV